MVAAAWNKVSAWEKGEGIREASQVMTRASSLLGRGERLLVGKPGRFLHNVPALERSALFCRETGRFLHNVPAWEKSACFRRWGIKESRRSGACPSRLLSQAGTLFQPNSPKPRRCARSRGISGSDGRFSPKPGPCSSRILPSKDVVHDRGEFLPLSAVSLPSRDDVPLQLSQAGTMCRIGENYGVWRPLARPSVPVFIGCSSFCATALISAKRPLMQPGSDAPWFLCTRRRRCVWVGGILVK